MKIIALFLLTFIFFACSDDKKIKSNTQEQEKIVIEQADEKIEVNDTNVPLPVGEPTSLLNTEIQHLSPFRQGGGG